MNEATVGLSSRGRTTRSDFPAEATAGTLWMLHLLPACRTDWFFSGGPSPMHSVSVAVPVWNGERYLEQAVASLLAQTRPPDEILIGDNASTDGTYRIACGIAAAEPTVHVTRRSENEGAAANFNTLARSAEGDLFAWLAADDVWSEDLLDGYVTAHLDEGVAVAYGTSRYIDERGESDGAPEPAIWSDALTPAGRVADLLADPIRSHFHCCHPVFGLMRRALLLDTGMIRRFGGSDKVLIFEMALRGRLTEVPQVFSRRRHPLSSVEANRDDISRRVWFDRSATGAPMPTSRLAAAMVAATFRAPISASERLRVGRQVAGWATRERRPRIMAGEAKSWLRAATGSAR